ncbi:hypothetical protein PFDG_00412 [Plasmodium falciparum Dd2]|uniref:Erythrocyte membrane protein 1 n=1 Tax=Plasmodium falciparum (isolate Dd2) TaxID=57267 RepID=A0A0L7LWJ1_PLAF4|nr:hypothetical protein PFDG_00412 [Plasmodium falciparum Dd2]
MAAAGSGGQGARDILEEFGAIIQEQAKAEAVQHRKDLEGRLSNVIFSNGDKVYTEDPCALNYTYHTNVTIGQGREDPCFGRQQVRFSDTKGAECYWSRIRGNGRNTGSCAPFRKLHMCDKNLEGIQPQQIETTHNLLVDVLLAAKHEGKSLVDKHEEYEKTNPDSKICTALARSFADIGDIVRGRDLFLGHKQGKQKLEESLKTMFDNIKEKNPALIPLENEEVREYWWIANRDQVWKAITCSAGESDKYFRKSSGGVYSFSGGKCGHNDDNVPTNLDYVPQHLRWFEEWAEDFCRKKKKKVENLQKQCRGQYQGADRYCSRNGYDCEKTVNARGKLRYGNRCIDCLYACNPYVEWIDNQRKQFLKQKKKYADEMKKYKNGAPVSGRQRRSARGTTTTNYEGYESKFYKELQSKNVGNLDNFLELLNNEKACTAVDDDKGGKIDFKTVNSGSAKNSDGNNKTFSHTEYCQPCPDCGVKKKSDATSGKKWEQKNGGMCKSGNLYKPKDKANPTPINFLYSGDRHEEINKKLEQFCKTQIGNGSVPGGASVSNSDSKELYQEWKCYEGKDVEIDGKDEDYEDDYHSEVKDAGGLCILENKNKSKGSETNSQKEPEQFQKTYNDFFYYWVVHMLKDSIHWRTKKIKGCLKNGTKTCGNQKCKGDCDCFLKWVKKKETEWKNIKIHFGKQDFGEQVGILGEEMRSPDFVLESVLKKEVLLTSLQEGYGNAKDIKHIEALLKEEENVVADSKKKNTIDKLIEHEDKDATKCIEKHKCQDPQPSTPGGDPGVARSGASPDQQAPPSEDEPEKNHSDSESEEEDEDENEEEEEEEEEEEAEAEKTVEVQVVPAPPPAQDGVNPCEIVKELFSDTTKFSDACGLKYGPGGKENFPNWKCISDKAATSGGGESGSPSRAKRGAEQPTRGSGNPTGDKGAICVPPRRRRLYIHKVENDGINTTESLRDWFVKSAAVETFFLWHKYKQENKSQGGGSSLGGVGGPFATLNGDSEDDKNNPEKMLQSGNIPPDFLRQMFYTLGDYRDILVGNTDIVLEALSSSEKEKMKEIQKKIDEILPKNDTSSGPPPVPPNSDKDPESWWNNNAKHIWHGMICALTYDTNSGGKTIEKVKTQENNLLNKLKDTYDYEKVKLDENSGTSPNSQTPSTSENAPTHLSKFVLRPPYFRYLEEWGQNFCKKRTEMLGKIKEECRNSDNPGHAYCSGDGHDCTDPDNQHNNMLADLYCPDCYKQCRKYRKWIDIKFVEYQNQKNKYGEEHGKLTKDNSKNDGDNKEFCKKIHNRSTAAQFLKELKHCKNSAGDGSDPNNKINFENPLETFNPSTYCETCPPNKVKCNSGSRRGQDPCTPDNGNNWEKVFGTISGNGGKSSTIEVEMIDRRGPYIEEYLKNSEKLQKSKDSFKTSRLFKGVRKQEWECRFNKEEKTDVCQLTNFDETIDLNQYTTFKVLLVYWLQDFIEGYYILKKKKKIDLCTQKEGKTCSEEPKNDCVCVKAWVDQKKKEWKQIQEHFKNREQEDIDNNMKSSVRQLLEYLQYRTELNEAIKPCKKIIDFESKQCNEAASSENGQKTDVIDCLLENLKKKIGECTSQPSVENPAQCEGSAPLPDEEEDLLLEEEENTANTAPKICDDVLKTQPQPEEPGETCEESPVVPEKKEQEPAAEPEADKGTEKDDTEEKSQEPVNPAPDPPKPQRPRRPRRTPQIVDHPAVIPALVTSTLAWSVGIGFATFTYFYLKKKTKHPVDLFSVINIPKSDYDIPTKLSPNRYIPYTSGKYRGKRYIYLEGDSGTDSGYTDHYSDITSSESEYEEMDINDIYVPGSPKYKTLIEVVLEPSGKLSGNTIPTSGNNTTASDTQNDIQNDGIPSSKITDNEWNTLKDEFISQYLQSEQPNDVPNDYTSGNSSTNTNITTTSRHNVNQKPFIMSIHDRNLYSGEEISYNINMVNNDIPMIARNGTYTGIDLINDSLSGDYDIYDEILKRKENELFGTNHTKKNTSTNSVAKPARDDPLLNQLELFHKWLDRHRDMCEQWNNKEELLDKLKEEWENETHSGNTHPSDSNKTLNTDVSIQIHMDNPKPINEFTNMDTYPNNSSMDTILEDLDKPFNEPYYYDMYDDDIYYDVNDHDASTVDTNAMDVPSKVQIEMDINTKLVKEKYPIADVWDI